MPQYWNHLTGFDYNLKPLFFFFKTATLDLNVIFY